MSDLASFSAPGPASNEPHGDELDVSPQRTRLAPLEDLEAMVGRLPAAKARHDLGAALEEACAAVETAEPLAAGLEAAAFLLTEARQALTDDDTTAIQERLRQTEAVANDLSTAKTTEDFSQVRYRLKDLGGAVQILDDRVQRAWKKRISAFFDAMDPLGRVLERVPDTASIGEEFCDLGRQAEALKASKVVATDRLVLFQELKARREGLLDRLSQKGLDAEVVRFLEDVAVNHDGVPLSRLTEPVFRWMGAAGAREIFRVRLSN